MSKSILACWENSFECMRVYETFLLKSPFRPKLTEADMQADDIYLFLVKSQAYQSKEN